MITHLASPGDLAGDRLEIAGPAYRHLFRARRLAAGARLRVVDGRGTARWGEVVRVAGDRAVVDLGEAAPAHEASYRLELVVAALRRERASWLVEKATELGVWAVRFVSCERTPRRYGRGSLERLRRVAAAALEQCHRSRLPEVSGVDPWDRVPALLEAAAPGENADRFFLDRQAGPPSGRGAGGREARGEAGVVLVGPEGGWSRREAAELADLGCRRVGLGPRTLRTETAAIVAAARLLVGGGG